MPISRKYRPQLFKDVTGQQHITETLRKEVDSGMLGHAYLFSGPRGVGKTTTARIFAKSLLNEVTDHGEPLLDSESSHQIDQGNCIDFIEIDAASHTGVDHVREVIIDHVRFAPARWKRKVYVIDECHMLSTSAWNALLKTLEEPPEYAFFILATTELHKVPETIKSRCQRFEFKRIQPDALAERIVMLSKEEGIVIDDAVVQRIVHASDGCLRDAESLMDQLISLGSDKISIDIASLVLPTSMLPKVSKLFDKASKRDLSSCLIYVKELMSEGMSPLEIIQDMLEAVRLLIRIQDKEEYKRFEQGDEGDRSIVALDGVYSLGELSEMALMLLERRRDIKVGTDPLFSLELAMCAIAGGLLPHASGAPSLPPPRALSPVPETDEKKAQIKTNEKMEIRDQRSEIGIDNPSVENVADAQKMNDEHLHSEIGIKENIDIPTKEVFIGDQAKVVREETSRSQISDLKSLSFDIHDVRKFWSVIIKEVEKQNHSLPFILKVSQADHIEGNTIHIRFQYPFHKEKLLDDMKTRRIVEEAIRVILQNEQILIDGFCSGKIEEENRSLESAPADVVSRVLGAFGGSIIE